MHSFEEAFCAGRHCRPDEFCNKALSECLYPHARFIWPFLDLCGARTTLAAITLLEVTGSARTEDDLREVIQQYLEEVYPNIGTVTKALRLRISVQRLIALYREVCGEQQIANRPMATEPAV